MHIYIAICLAVYVWVYVVMQMSCLKLTKNMYRTVYVLICLYLAST